MTIEKRTSSRETQKTKEHKKAPYRQNNPELKRRQDIEMRELQRKKGLSILITKAESRKQRHQLNEDIKKNPQIKPIDAGDEKFEAFKKNKDIFHKTYGSYNKQVCGWLGLNNNLSLSMIERESGYDKNAKSETQADGFSQLTDDPFADMKISFKGGRGDEYAKYFKSMPESIISQADDQSIRSTLKNMKILASREPIPANLWNRNINFLEKYRKKPKLNLLMGNMYLNFLKNEANDERMDKMISKLSRLIADISRDTKGKKGKKVALRFKTLLNEKGISVNNELGELKNLRTKLANKANKDLREKFYALARYNGQADKGLDLVEHKIMYAATVLTAEKLRNTNKLV